MIAAGGPGMTETGDRTPSIARAAQACASTHFLAGLARIS